MAPEYAIDGVCSVKADVFSFGVLLLEMVSGINAREFYWKNDYKSFVGFVRFLFIATKSIIIYFYKTARSLIISDSTDAEPMASRQSARYRRPIFHIIIIIIIFVSTRRSSLRCIQIGLLCVQAHREDRPPMASIILMLGSQNELISLPKPPADLLLLQDPQGESFTASVATG